MLNAQSDVMTARRAARLIEEARFSPPTLPTTFPPGQSPSPRASEVRVPGAGTHDLVRSGGAMVEELRALIAETRRTLKGASPVALSLSKVVVSADKLSDRLDAQLTRAEHLVQRIDAFETLLANPNFQQAEAFIEQLAEAATSAHEEALRAQRAAEEAEERAQTGSQRAVERAAERVDTLVASVDGALDAEEADAAERIEAAGEALTERAAELEQRVEAALSEHGDYGRRIEEARRAFEQTVRGFDGDAQRAVDGAAARIDGLLDAVDAAIQDRVERGRRLEQVAAESVARTATALVARAQERIDELSALERSATARAARAVEEAEARSERVAEAIADRARRAEDGAMANIARERKRVAKALSALRRRVAEALRLTGLRRRLGEPSVPDLTLELEGAARRAEALTAELRSLNGQAESTRRSLGESIVRAAPVIDGYTIRRRRLEDAIRRAEHVAERVDPSGLSIDATAASPLDPPSAAA